MPKSWVEVEKDPEFLGLPKDAQDEVRHAYLQDAEADPEFQQLPQADQDEVRRAIAPEPVRDGARAAATAITRKATSAGEIFGDTLNGQPERARFEQTDAGAPGTMVGMPASRPNFDTNPLGVPEPVRQALQFESEMARETIIEPIERLIERMAPVEVRLGEDFKEPSKGAMYARAVAEKAFEYSPKMPSDLLAFYLGGKVMSAGIKAGLVAASNSMPRKILAGLMPISRTTEAIPEGAFSLGEGHSGLGAVTKNLWAARKVPGDVVDTLLTRASASHGFMPGAEAEAFKDLYAKQLVRKALGAPPLPWPEREAVPALDLHGAPPAPGAPEPIITPAGMAQHGLIVPPGAPNEAGMLRATEEALVKSGWDPFASAEEAHRRVGQAASTIVQGAFQQAAAEEAALPPEAPPAPAQAAVEPLAVPEVKPEIQPHDTAALAQVPQDEAVAAIQAQAPPEAPISPQEAAQTHQAIVEAAVATGQPVSAAAIESYADYDPVPEGADTSFDPVALEAENAALAQATKPAPERFPMDPKLFNDVLAQRKLKPGDRVTVKMGFQPPDLKWVPKGRKLKFLSADLNTSQVLAQTEGGDIVLVDALDLEETFAEPPAPEKPLPVKAQVAESTGLAKPEASVQMTPLEALKVKLANQATGSRRGFAEGRRTEKAKLMVEFRQKFDEFKLEASASEAQIKKTYETVRAWETAIRAKVSEFVTTFLPTSERGRFIQMVRDAKSPKDLARALLRVNNHAEAIHKKELITDFWKIVDRALESPSVSVAQKIRIRAISDGYKKHGYSPEREADLWEEQMFLDQAEQHGEVVDVPREVLRQIANLTKLHLDAVPAQQIERMVDELKMLEEIGHLESGIAKANYEAKVERATVFLEQGSTPIDKLPQIARRHGETLSTQAKFDNYINKWLDAYRAVDQALPITPIDVALDLQGKNGGYTDAPYILLKQGLDMRWRSYKSEFLPIQDALTKASKDLKLDKPARERVFLYATSRQAGGKEKLDALDAKVIPLTENEMVFYKMLRREFDAVLPRLRLLAKENNIELVEEPNYFAWIRDNDAMSEVDVFLRLGEGYSGVGRFQKNVSAGWLNERVGGAMKSKTDALDVALRHLDEVYYAIHLGSEIKFLSDVVRSPRAGKALGEIAQLYDLKWLTLMAKKGGIEGAKKSELVDIIRNNYGLARIAWNFGTTLLNASTIINAGIGIGAKYTAIGLYDFLLNKKAQDFVRLHMPEVRDRKGGEPAYGDFTPASGFGHLGMMPTMLFDYIPAGASAWGAYLKNLNQKGVGLNYEKPDQDAINYAMRKTHRTQASSSFKDAPLAFSAGGITGNKSWDKAITQFKLFQANFYSLVRHDVIRLGWRGRNDQNTPEALFFLIASLAASYGIQKGVDSLFYEDKDETLGGELMKNALRQIPFVGDIVSMGIYGSGPIPMLNAFTQGSKGLYQALNGKEKTTRLKGISRAMEAIASTGIPGLVPAIPGAATIGRFTRLAIGNKSNSTVSQGRPEVIRSRR